MLGYAIIIERSDINIKKKLTPTTHKSGQGVSLQLTMFGLLSRLGDQDLCGLFKTN